MANSPITTDLFKFMSVRTTTKPSLLENDLSYIRDKRMNGDVFLKNVDMNDTLGKKILDEIFGYLLVYYDGSQKSFKNRKKDIDDLLNSFESTLDPGLLTEDGISAKTLVDELIMVINKYLLNFDRCNLIKDIECAIKTYTDNSANTLQLFFYGSSPSMYSQIQQELFNRFYILYIFKRKYPINMEYMFKGLRALNVLFWLEHDNRIEPCANSLQNNNGCLGLFNNLFGKKGNTNIVNPKVPSKGQVTSVYKEPDKTVLNTAGDLNNAFNATVVISPVLSALCFYNSPFNEIKPIGVGDLKIVKEKLCRYEAGEVAHIENVLRGESKERIHRRLDRLEDLFTRETEQVQENTRDTQTTDRFEVKKEIENTVNEDMQANVNASGSISGSYGLVQYNAAASAGFSYGRSTSDATRSANNYVKEIVDRSVTRVQNKISETRTTKKINEVEETNRHAINNEKSTSNVSGIYRYVDKRYKSQLYNYGKRVMFEFIIPEPAFFFKSVFEKLKTAPSSIDSKPTKPDFPHLAINAIDQNTINTWSAKFNLTNAKPEPSPTIIINTAVSNLDLPQNSAYKEAVQVPENYFAISAGANGVYITKDSSNCFFDMNIGNDHHGVFNSITQNVPTNKVKQFMKNFVTFGPIEKQVLISVLTNDILAYSINVTIHCDLRDDKKREWQIDTYNKIMDAYDNALKDYENKLAEYNNKKESADAQNSGVEIKGQNPKFNEEIIKAEFKKHCIAIITKDYDTDTDADFVSTSKAIGERTIDATTTPITKIPALNLNETKKISSFIQFIEQAFDWNNLTYLLYSYLWHTENKWYETFKTYEETDPLFGAFLRAGSARVLIPVLPIYEISVMHFLYTKVVWNGGEAPAIDDELYIPIHEEIRNQQDDLNGAVPELDKDGKPIVWEYVVPTPLVYLQDSSELPVFNCNII